MGLFKRKRDDEEAGTDEVDDQTPEVETDDVPAGPTRPQGPWDDADAPDADGVQFLDLGGMRIPVPAGTEVRVEMNPERQVVAATLVHGGSAMQVSAFAAPRT